jgi:hypothetical protein
VEVAIDAMQSLGGNGYINGTLRPLYSAHSVLILAGQIILLGGYFAMRGCTVSAQGLRKLDECLLEENLMLILGLFNLLFGH